ncbi:lysozyme [bacterium]|nr:lysozyme [bacterium]
MNLTKNELEHALVRDEGLVKLAYEDTIGKITIGVGRNLDDLGITEEEAMMLLRNDIDRVKMEVEDRCEWVKDLDATRRNVIYNMVFNMGIVRFLGFKKTIALIEKKDYVGASIEMLDSKWSKQVGRRAVRLAETMSSGMFV